MFFVVVFLCVCVFVVVVAVFNGEEVRRVCVGGGVGGVAIIVLYR